MGPIKNPYLAALLVGILQMVAAKYPDLKPLIDGFLLSIGFGYAGKVLNAVNGGSNGANGNSTGYPSTNSKPPTG